MLATLKQKLQMSVSFPSPPAVAMRIIALMGDPDAELAEIAGVISQDPALTVKVLRVANSPLYSTRRKSENLRQALVALGMNAASTLALSFSLVGAYSNCPAAGLNHTQFWRRAILSASAARRLGALAGIRTPEELFLAALVQDIGALGIDRVSPEFYASLPATATHGALVAHELASLGADHAQIGAWLLRHWRIPESLCAIVALSHDPNPEPAATPLGLAARCVALGGDCTDVLLGTADAANVEAVAGRSQALLGIDAASLGDALASLVAEIPEIERLFDTKIMDAGYATGIVEHARDLLTMRTMRALQQVSSLEEDLQLLEERTATLEDQHRRDALTGVFNRGYLDVIIDKEFRSAQAGAWPLSLVFVDLDRFKQVNDTYGHPAGDAVLIATAKVILDVVRDTDFVARYGGEEFVIVLAGIGMTAALRVCERLLARLRTTDHVFPGGAIRATASLGLATLCAETPFASAAQLIAAADRCMYSAKEAGRDRLVHYQPGMSAA
jgi:diguanylate cyclase (GGDEF)-like protein